MMCHDGTVAIDAHGGHMTARGTIGEGSRDLSNTHPIGFSYDDSMIARGPLELVEKSQYLPTAISNTTGVIRNGTRKVSDILYAGSIVTCSSCHDVHNCNNAKPDPGHNYNYLLWAKEEQSLICLTCHIK
ncbi:MAG TPA: hypothetical protein VN642_19670 [Dongiaceae bacterium]|nr:hypothetical protein [Dongiaceae bacterium]